MKLAVLLLAAGAGRRFGADKRVALLPSGESLLASTLALYMREPGNCTVVIDIADDALAASLTVAGASIVRVDSRRAPCGMGDSLAAGVQQISSQGYDACLVALGDMPWIKPQTVTAIIAALAESPLVVPACGGRWGHPVAFDARYYTELSQLSGDRGARGVLQRHLAACRVLEVEDQGVVRDVDTMDDLAASNAVKT